MSLEALDHIERKQGRMGAMPNLDLLRSIAITLVVVDHTIGIQGIWYLGRWKVEWIGLIGVYMFFVHTCLVLMWSLERKPHTLDFYIRRVFRIYPLAIVAIVFAVLTRAPLSGTNAIPWNLRQFIQNCLLMQNFHGVSYIAVLWSLPLEVDMYILLPVLFFFVRKNFSQWPLLLIWALAAEFCRSTMSPISNNLVMVIPNFLPGVMAYVAFAKRRATLPAWLFPLFVALLFSLLMSFPSLKWSWVFSLALGLGLPSFKQMTGKVVKRVSHEVAKYSYGIYLAHPFGIWIGFFLLRQASLPIKILVELACSITFAIASYHLIEKPMIRLGSRIATHAEMRYEQMEYAKSDA